MKKSFEVIRQALKELKEGTYTVGWEEYLFDTVIKDEKELCEFIKTEATDEEFDFICSMLAYMFIQMNGNDLYSTVLEKICGMKDSDHKNNLLSHFKEVSEYHWEWYPHRQ